MNSNYSNTPLVGLCISYCYELLFWFTHKILFFSLKFSPKFSPKFYHYTGERGCVIWRETCMENHNKFIWMSVSFSSTPFPHMRHTVLPHNIYIHWYGLRESRLTIISGRWLYWMLPSKFQQSTWPLRSRKYNSFIVLCPIITLKTCFSRFSQLLLDETRFWLQIR